MLDLCISAVFFYLFGYAFLYGETTGNGFIGGDSFALKVRVYNKNTYTVNPPRDLIPPPAPPSKPVKGSRTFGVFTWEGGWERSFAARLERAHARVGG